MVKFKKPGEIKMDIREIKTIWPSWKAHEMRKLIEDNMLHRESFLW